MNINKNIVRFISIIGMITVIVGCSGSGDSNVNSTNANSCELENQYGCFGGDTRFGDNEARGIWTLDTRVGDDELYIDSTTVHSPGGWINGTTYAQAHSYRTTGTTLNLFIDGSFSTVNGSTGSYGISEDGYSIKFSDKLLDIEILSKKEAYIKTPDPLPDTDCYEVSYGASNMAIMCPK